MSSEILWEPSADRIENSNIFHFMKFVEKKTGKRLKSYDELWKWSVENIDDFWLSIWDFCGVKAETRGDRIRNKAENFWENRFFPDSKMNFAENLLQRRDDTPAIIFWGEEKVRTEITWNELYREVVRVANALKSIDIKHGDVVCGYVANMPQTIIAALATISIGAIWCSCSPDFGINGALDRFTQVNPKVLFAVDGYYYKGKVFDNREKIKSVAANLSMLEKVVVIPFIGVSSIPDMTVSTSMFGDFSSNQKDSEFKFEQFSGCDPIYILFTSGTTGVPKCIVHTACGTLLQHKKEQILHCDIKKDDRVFYFTTCSWMMWNWQTSILSNGATLLLYEGCPTYPKADILFDMADQCGMTMFGTSAKYLDMLAKTESCPIKTHCLKNLKTIGCTGAPLGAESYKFVYNHIKKDVHLNCFSGGTDIISCFITGNPISKVRSGEMQSRGLGMDVDVYDDNGKSNYETNHQGELVCKKPFASQPLSFWNDKDNKRYRAAYFEKFDNVWCHGDWIEFTESGGIIISGRADAILNPGGVRIGTAEIYNQVQKIYEVLECIAVGQRWEDDERIILFVKLREGFDLTDELLDRIKKIIRSNTTPRHVPAKIIKINAIPKTKNGKITELAVKEVIHGRDVKNKESLEDARVLDLYMNIEELKK